MVVCFHSKNDMDIENNIDMKNDVCLHVYLNV